MEQNNIPGPAGISTGRAPIPLNDPPGNGACAPDSEYIIRLDHMVKIFQGQRTVTAVNDVSFNVRRGKYSDCLARMEPEKARSYVS